MLTKSGEVVEYASFCVDARNNKFQVVLRAFNAADAELQGHALIATATDMRIIDRALELLHHGANPDSSDNRVCDQSHYPFKWSLFCAMHQASIDVDGVYRHLRPAVRAVRKAIGQLKPVLSTHICFRITITKATTSVKFSRLLH